MAAKTKTVSKEKEMYAAIRAAGQQGKGLISLINKAVVLTINHRLENYHSDKGVVELYQTIVDYAPRKYKAAYLNALAQTCGCTINPSKTAISGFVAKKSKALLQEYSESERIVAQQMLLERGLDHFLEQKETKEKEKPSELLKAWKKTSNGVSKYLKLAEELYTEEDPDVLWVLQKLDETCKELEDLVHKKTILSDNTAPTQSPIKDYMIKHTLTKPLLLEGECVVEEKEVFAA